MKREVSILYGIVSNEIQKHINTFFFKYYSSSMKNYYSSILFFIINNSYDETNINKFIDINLNFVNTNLGTTFKLSAEKSKIMIGNKEEFYGYLHTGDFVDYSFLKIFSDIFYLSLKRVSLNKRYKETLNFSQFILDNIENIIIVLDENKHIINYNLQAITHFGEGLLNLSIFDLMEIDERIFNFKNQLDKKEFEYFKKDYYYKVKITSYKNNRYIVDVYPEKIYDYLKTNVIRNTNLVFEENEIFLNYAHAFETIFNCGVVVDILHFNKKIFTFKTKRYTSTKLKYFIELNENYKVYFCFDSIIKTNTNILKEMENVLKINFKIKHDELTSLYRREELYKSIQNILKNKKNALLLIIDINKFKEFNDKNGHIFGDMILRKFSESMVNNFRKNDLIARVGGDEFGILMFENSLGDEIKYINRIKKNLNGLITFSYGCSEINGSKDSIEEYFEEADQNMYSNK